MMRTQPPGFRWLVGGFALAAAVAFGWQYRSAGDRADLVLGVLCLVVAGYWLIFDREPPRERLDGDRFDGDRFDGERFDGERFDGEQLDSDLKDGP